jgi:hypothetical protein
LELIVGPREQFRRGFIVPANQLNAMADDVGEVSARQDSGPDAPDPASARVWAQITAATAPTPGVITQYSWQIVKISPVASNAMPLWASVGVGYSGGPGNNPAYEYSSNNPAVPIGSVVEVFPGPPDSDAGGSSDSLIFFYPVQCNAIANISFYAAGSQICYTVTYCDGTTKNTCFETPCCNHSSSSSSGAPQFYYCVTGNEIIVPECLLMTADQASAMEDFGYNVAGPYATSNECADNCQPTPFCNCCGMTTLCTCQVKIELPDLPGGAITTDAVYDPTGSSFGTPAWVVNYSGAVTINLVFICVSDTIMQMQSGTVTYPPGACPDCPGGGTVTFPPGMSPITSTCDGGGVWTYSLLAASDPNNCTNGGLITIVFQGGVP